MKTEIVIFDYGNTLVEEKDFCGIDGVKAFMQYIIINPRQVEAEEINNMLDVLYKEAMDISKNVQCEFSYLNMQRYVFDYLGLKFNKSEYELEKIYWDNAAHGSGNKDTEQFLDFLNDNNIRTGVISNMAYSGYNLKRRLDEIFPNNKFEFVLSSSDYVYRKPRKQLFELAISISNLSSGQIMYCGDKYETDVQGALNAGMEGVLVHFDILGKNKEAKPNGEYISIKKWSELEKIIRL